MKIHFSTFLMRVFLVFLPHHKDFWEFTVSKVSWWPSMDTEGDKHMTFFNCKNGKNFESFFFHQPFFWRKENFVSVSKKQKKQES